MRTTLILGLTLVALFASSGCDDSAVPPNSDASTYNPDTRLADAGGDKQWDAGERSLTNLPTRPQIKSPQTAQDPRVRAFEYPGAQFETDMDLTGMKVLYYNTTDAFETVTKHYDGLSGVKGEAYGEQAAAYAGVLPDGSTLTITINGQEIGGCQIILNVSR